MHYLHAHAFAYIILIELRRHVAFFAQARGIYQDLKTPSAAMPFRQGAIDLRAHSDETTICV